jgi:hypothetical protein
MTDEKTGPEKGASQFEKAGAKNASLARELMGFLGRNKKWWLLPILLVFVLFGAVAILGTTAAAPFIYTFF